MSDLPTEVFTRAFLANPAGRVHQVAATIFRPPPPVDYNAWAVEHVIIGAESPFPGPYNPNRLPFWRKILEVLAPDDPGVVVSLCGSAQIGKTFVAEIFIGASLDLDPGQILYVQATESNAVKFARTKWRPMIRATPRLGEIFDLRQSKEGGNSTLYQERKDGRGSIILTGANSAAALSMISVPRQVQDDLSKWEKNLAGDPENQADSRSKAFLEMGAKILKIGTPLLKGSCRITRVVGRGTDDHYHVPCPHCRHLHPLEPENFVEHLDPDNPAGAHFTCPECEEKIEYRHRAWMVDPANGAMWVSHQPGAADWSFTLWAAYAGLESWATMARGYLDSLGDPEAEQVWWNDTAGRAYELPGEAPPWEDLKRRGDASGRQLGQVPRGALLLTLSLDVQDEYVDGVVLGWGRNLTRYVVARVRVEGFIGNPETRQELRRLVEFKWPTFCGTTRPVDLAGIDANAWTDEVFDWAQGFPKSQLLMLRGMRGDATPTLSMVRRERRHDGRVVKYQGRFYNVGVNGIKGALYKLLRVEVPGARGYVDFPLGLDDDFYEQLTSEKRTPVMDRAGFTVYQWVKPRALRNEQLDCYDAETEVLTEGGWRRFVDITTNDSLATVNLDTDQIEYHRPSAVIIREHDGDMVHLHGRRLDIMVTPGHRMVTYKKEQRTENGERRWHFDVPPKITLARDLTINHQIKMTAKWEGAALTKIVVPASHKAICGTEIEPERAVDAGDWAEFLGWYVAEGNRQTVVSATQGNRRYRIAVAQNWGPKLARIKALLGRLPWRWHQDHRGGGAVLIITSKQLFEALAECGDGAANKRVPAWVKTASPAVISRFVDAAIAGDGWQDQRSGFRMYATVSQTLADDMQELFIKSGKAANIAKKQPGPCLISSRPDGPVKEQFWISECRAPKASLDTSAHGGRQFIGKMVSYSGPVYCATVPTGTLICRRHGRSFIAGNCAVYGQALATKLGWRVMTPEHWDRLSASREVDTDNNSDEHAANEFWNKEANAIPTVAEPEPAAAPRPPAPPPAPVVIRSRTMGPTRRF